MIIAVIPSGKKTKCNKMTRSAVRPTKPPIQWLKRVSFQAVKRPGPMLTTHIYDALRMRGAVPPILHMPLCFKQGSLLNLNL